MSEEFVPGYWKCPKCKYILTTNTLNPVTGDVGVDDTAFEICPNDMTQMSRVSWKERCKEVMDICEDQIHRAVNCEHLLRQVFYARCALGTKFCDELENWKLEDLREQILRALGDWNS